MKAKLIRECGVDSNKKKKFQVFFEAVSDVKKSHYYNFRLFY